MNKSDNICRNMVKVLLAALVNKDKEIYTLSRMLENNESVYSFCATPTPILPLPEIVDVLGITDEKECQKVCDKLEDLTLTDKKDIDEDIEKFMKEYGL